MSVRSTVKAIILDNGKVLLNRCYDEPNGDYYSLPGGGQEQYETLYDALVRECLEETGYTVEPLRFAALMEEICDSAFIRETYPEYAHKMLHLFVCRLVTRVVKKPTEKDSSQIACEWVEIGDIARINLLPKAGEDAFYGTGQQQQSDVSGLGSYCGQPWLSIVYRKGAPYDAGCCGRRMCADQAG